ncbi:30S ribosomal protein S3, chloroplastic [Quillaja saponaria]|uniref:Small ribosomal subunit protein uS3c n=1 Tax=Quillaja saponaria TaxID=32244 RepID=A0AAD7P447_QUISA|nr:30S ribosomal protein S3, chloroplastic [Quillaja saponaria]
MPLGTAIHNIEITLGKGGQLARAAGAVAKLIAKEGKSATLKLPLGRIEELQMNVQKKFNCVNRKLNIGITRIANPYGHPNILAEFIAGQLKNRVSFRKAMKKAIELTEQAGTKGVQVQIAGRIDGKEIARVEWIREGRVPLQTIRAKIDYCSYTVRTIYGVLGIKIWIFVNEEQ